MLTEEEINKITSKIKNKPTQDQIKWLIERPWWDNDLHVKINNFLQQHINNTHIVAMPDDKKYYKNFIKKSKFYLAENVKFIKMKQSGCHENCLELFLNNEIDFCVFGYALSDDGLFRSHSWGIKDGIVIETTEPRLLYFGYVLTTTF